MSTAWLHAIVLSSAAIVLAINRPVYKIVLKQKGYAQFLQYDIDTPPLREFTFCAWYRMDDLTIDQTLFAYVSNSNNRLVRLWLDLQLSEINVSIDERATSSAPIILGKDFWRHICLSYQSDYGAWAVYVDSRLISCQVSQSLYGYILPGGGSFIIGYGTDTNGAQQGFHGEVFGANMILRSTIERNYTMKSNPLFEQKTFHKNRLKYDEQPNEYIILNDLLTEELNNNFKTTEVPRSTTQTSKNFIKLKTSHSFIDHEVGKSTTRPASYPINNKELINFLVNNKDISKNNEPYQSKNLPTLSQYDVPPSPQAFNMYDKLAKELKISIPSAKLTQETSTECTRCSLENKYPAELFEFDLPPPVEQNPKIYGQWTSSKFAGNVFNYLKSVNFRAREQKKIIPQTIPLTKASDVFPYSSDFKVVKIQPLPQFKRKNIVEKQQLDFKRMPQINLQIFGDDLRSNILKYHPDIWPEKVEVHNRDIIKTKVGSRFYRDVNRQKVHETSNESNEKLFQSKPVHLRKATKHNKDTNPLKQNPMNILPFLKSFQNIMDGTRDSESPNDRNVLKSNEIYTRSLSIGNKWHNVKSYSNDYTPREIKIGFSNGQQNIDDKIAQANKKNPGIRIRYKHKDRKLNNHDVMMMQGRKLATQVSHQSNANKDDSVSIFKYQNHGHLTDKKSTITSKDVDADDNFNLKVNEKRNFNKRVKIGNALNERPVIGDSVDQNKKSFVGGDENIPDINKYRGVTAFESTVIVPSTQGSRIGPRICKNLELYDRVLYVQPDESIDMTHIMSPVRLKNIGIEFIMQNYKKCSLQESSLQKNSMLFIDWNKTPVRLFGGAHPQKTRDLCGFF